MHAAGVTRNCAGSQNIKLAGAQFENSFVQFSGYLEISPTKRSFYWFAAAREPKEPKEPKESGGSGGKAADRSSKAASSSDRKSGVSALPSFDRKGGVDRKSGGAVAAAASDAFSDAFAITRGRVALFVMIIAFVPRHSARR